jgi:acyl carrier protein/D-alanine--poly(phosphoribitol) ligase subunit 2
MAEDLKDGVLEYIKNEYLDEDDETELTCETPLISSGVVDSFSMISLKVFLEKKFNIQIPDTKATPEAFDTVNSIAALVEEIRGQ